MYKTAVLHFNQKGKYRSSWRHSSNKCSSILQRAPRRLQSSPIKWATTKSGRPRAAAAQVDANVIVCACVIQHNLTHTSWAENSPYIHYEYTVYLTVTSLNELRQTHFQYPPMPLEWPVSNLPLSASPWQYPVTCSRPHLSSAVPSQQLG